jgi:ubiquinone/menaquinone biosynthesis C-methylase UbiE
MESMPFLPESAEEWINSHIVFIPHETKAFCGDLSGVTMLDLGCGDMIADIGLLSLGIKHITGIDVLIRDWDVPGRAAQSILDAGYTVPQDYGSRLSYLSYDGVNFPFCDNSFDVVFSWSAFEHISDVLAILREIRRVVKPFGRVFLQVYPWFPSYCGSHISDFIREP